jgi:hypothetical protein
MRKRSFIGLAALAAFAMAMHVSAGAPGVHGLVTSFDWVENDPAFGGLSAIEVSDDGSTFTALSDRSTVFTGHLVRDDTGQITRITDVIIAPLLAENGQPLTRDFDDSEGLAIAPDGTVFVSQEGPARVLRYGHTEDAASILTSPPAFSAMQHNSSLEALAVSSSGALYTLPERSGATDRPFPVFRYANGRWTQPFTIPREGDYLPTGADFGPDGMLYILERNFQGIAGFQSRVRRFSETGAGGETVLETYLGQHGNLEGLSVWRDTNGAIRLTMISDDNYRFFLRTTLVEYAITD